MTGAGGGMTDLNWLTARPIAHRGLHDPRNGVIENTQSAVARAVDHGFAIEVDLQISADGEAMVFHDETLDRLTEASGPVADRSAQELVSVRFRETGDHMQTLPALLQQVSGEATLILELKSLWNENTVLARRTAEVLDDYAGPVAVMSFDPALITASRSLAPDRVRGIVACRFDDAAEWPALSASQRLGLRFFSHMAQTRPHFVSYDIMALESVAPRLLRAVGVPLITWTVRDETQANYGATWADQITFEGFLPDTA